MAAAGHSYKNNLLKGKWYVYPEMATAGLWTTPSDLARAGIELQLALKPESNLVFSAQTAARILSPVVEDRMGIAFFLSGSGHSRRFGHDGWNEGFVAEMTMYRDGGKGAVIMLNSNEGYPGLLFEIERAIAQEYKWEGYFAEGKKRLTLSPERLREFSGTYLHKSGLEYSVIDENDHLLLKAACEPPIEIFPQSPTNFFTTLLNTEITFTRTEDGHVKELTFRQEGKSFTAERKP